MKQPEEVRKQINMVSGGEASGYGLLTVRENLWMFAQFYGIPTPVANARIRALMEKVSLLDRINTKSSELSTGLRQKMNIVRGFLTDPKVLFLDEPTLGLDVAASLDVRRFVRGWVNEDPSRTLLLTTHYMVEADELCDRVAIINKGQVLACDTPANLKQALQREAIFEVSLHTPQKLEVESIRSLAGVNRVSVKELDGSTPTGADPGRRGRPFRSDCRLHQPERAHPQPAKARTNPGRCFRDPGGTAHGRGGGGGECRACRPLTERMTGLRLFLMTVIGRSYPRIIGMQREKSWMFFDTFLPMLGVAGYVFVYRALQAPEDYIGFVIVGGAMTAFWMNILWSMSSQLYWEKETGNLPLYIIAPGPMMAILLGMALGGLVATTLRGGCHHPAGSLLFNVHYVVCLTAAAAVGLFCGDGGAVWHGHDDRLALPAAQPRGLAHRQPGPGANLFRLRLLLPDQELSVLGGGLRLDHAADPRPGRHAPTGFCHRALAGLFQHGHRTVILVALAVIFLLAARFLLNYMEKLAVREGRLTESRR